MRMTKQREMDILESAAAALGPDSYCGPWLRSLLPELEAQIRSDQLPAPALATPAAAQAEAASILDCAKQQAAAIEAEAQRRAAALMERHLHEVQDVRRRAKRELERAAAQIFP